MIKRRNSASPPGSPSAKRMQIDSQKDDEDDSLAPLIEGSTEKQKEDGLNEEDGEDAVAMDDDEYTKQSAYQAQLKEDLHLLASNFDPQQAERYSIYREVGLKGANVKKVLTGIGLNNVHAGVLPLVGGVAKVFVGEMIEKAREVQAARGEKGPLSPDHLREAYRLHVAETGRVGPAPPLRGKPLFFR